MRPITFRPLLPRRSEGRSIPGPRCATGGARRLVVGLAVGATVVLAACTAGASSSPLASPATSASVQPSASGSASPSPSPAPAFPVSLTDDEGSTVELPAEPQTIVSLTPAATETLFALGVGDRIAGVVEDFTPYPPAAAELPIVAKFGEVDVEKIVELDPDLVIAGGNNFNPPDAIERLKSLGLPVLVVYAPDLDTVYDDIELLGAATGRGEESRDLTASMRAAFDQVAAATRDAPRPRVYYELDATGGFFGPAPDYFGTEMIELAGGEPLTTGTAGSFQMPPERIIEFDPEVILLGDAAYGVTAEAVAARPGWDVLSAVKDGEIRPIDDVIVTRPGPRLVEGLWALATAINPELALGPLPSLPVEVP